MSQRLCNECDFFNPLTGECDQLYGGYLGDRSNKPACAFLHIPAFCDDCNSYKLLGGCSNPKSGRMGDVTGQIKCPHFEPYQPSKPGGFLNEIEDDAGSGDSCDCAEGGCADKGCSCK